MGALAGPRATVGELVSFLTVRARRSALLLTRLRRNAVSSPEIHAERAQALARTRGETTSARMRVSPMSNEGAGEVDLLTEWGKTAWRV